MVQSRSLKIFNLLSCFLLAFFADSVAQVQPIHPRLLITPAEIVVVKENIQKHPECKQTFQSLLLAAEPFASKDSAWIVASFPDYAATLANDAFRDDNGTKLNFSFDKKSGGKHPITGEFIQNDKLKNAWANCYNAELQEILFALGNLYAFTGDIQFAKKVKLILLEYYKHFSGDGAKKWEFNKYIFKLPSLMGVLQHITLYDAEYIIRATAAYDLTLNSNIYTEKDKKQILDGFFVPVALNIMKAKHPLHDKNIVNWHCAHLSAVAAVASLKEEDEWMDFIWNGGKQGPWFYKNIPAQLKSWTTNDFTGMKQLIQEGYMADGLWVEGSPGYHAMGVGLLLDGLIIFENYNPKKYKVLGENSNEISTTINNSISLYNKLLMPGFNMVTDGDGGLNINGAMELLAFQAWKSKNQTQIGQVNVLRSASNFKFEKWGTGVTYHNFKYYQAPSENKTAKYPLQSALMPQSGFAFLKSGDVKDGFGVFMDYGTPGSGHYHYDKLHINLYGLGQPIITDYVPGGYAYAPAKELWFRYSYSHNTVIVDEKNQNLTTGELKVFDVNQGQMQVLNASCPTAYDNTNIYRRTIAIVGDIEGKQKYFVDVFRVNGGQTHDLFFHGNTDNCSWNQTEVEKISWPAHQQMKYLREGNSTGAVKKGSKTVLPDLEFTWNLPSNVSSKLFMPMNDNNYELVKGAHLKQAVSDFSMGYLMVRHTGGNSVFASVMDTYKENKGYIKSVDRKISFENVLSLTINTVDGIDYVYESQDSLVKFSEENGKHELSFQGSFARIKQMNDAITMLDLTKGTYLKTKNIGISLEKQGNAFLYQEGLNEFSYFSTSNSRVSLPIVYVKDFKVELTDLESGKVSVVSKLTLTSNLLVEINLPSGSYKIKISK